MNILKILSFLLFSNYIFAQQELLTIGTNQAPFSANWRNLKSSNFEMIFPSELENEAKRSVHMLEHLSPYVSDGYKVGPKKISIIFQPYSSISNGFVTLAPWRSEWFSMPWSANGMGTAYWTDMLAVHEMRHMRQMEALNVGFNRVLYWIFGEQGLAMGIGWTIHPWQLEGDAVVTETKYGPSGRGRVPLFSQHFRAMLASNRNLNYDRMALGSYREFIPDHYVYGYHFASMLTDLDSKIWQKIYWKTADSSYNPFSFYNAIKEQTGKSVVDDWHPLLFETWSKKYEVQTSSTLVESDWPIAKEDRWTSYERLRHCDDGTIIAVKKSLDYPKSLVQIKNDGETFLTFLGPQSDVPVDCKQNKVVWGEFVPDLRWGKQSYAQIWMMDLYSKKISLLATKTRWFSPTLHPKDESVVVVEVDLENKSKLLEVDFSGKIKRVIAESSSEIFMTPHLSASGVDLVYISLDKKLGQKSLKIRNVQSLNEEVLIASTFVDLGNPVVSDDYVCLEHPVDQKENISCLKRTDKKIFAMTGDAIGTAFPALYGNQLSYGQYTLLGYVPRKMQIDFAEKKLAEIPISLNPNDKITAYNQEHLDHEGRHVSTATASDSSSHYSLNRHSFNPHSWMLIASPFGPFITLEGLSTDKLSTLELAAGVAYNRYDLSGKVFARGLYGRYFPQFDVEASKQKRTYQSGYIYQNDWTEDQVEAGVSLPFNFSKRGYTHLLKFRGHGQYNSVSTDYVHFSNIHSNASILSKGLTVKWSWQSPRAYRDLFAPWGQSLMGQYLEGSGSGDWGKGGQMKSLGIQHFLPGLAKHHHLVFFTGLEEQDRDRNTYRYVSNLPFSRGYMADRTTRLSMLSANYYMPLAYPDYSFGKWLYLKRIFANFHYDWAKNTMAQYRSTGVETFFETNFFRNFYVSLQWGLRFSYLVDRQKWDVGLTLLNFTGNY